jgi:hypothetical protein
MDSPAQPAARRVGSRLVLGLDEPEETALVGFDVDCDADIILGYDWLRACYPADSGRRGAAARPRRTPSRSALDSASYYVTRPGLGVCFYPSLPPRSGPRPYRARP